MAGPSPPSKFDFNGAEPIPTVSPPSSNPARFAAFNASEVTTSATPSTSSAQVPAPAPAPAPQTDAHGRYLNPRSCVTCRKRKVKCDKLHPCSNCTRAHIDCVFPTPGRAPRKARKITDPKDNELLARLRRLEGVVQGLGVEVGGEESVEETPTSVNPHQAQQVNGTRAHPQSQGDMEYWLEDHKGSSFEHKFGRLVINEGRSRYVNSSFWANLSNEVEDLKGILNEDSDDDNADEGSPQSVPHMSGHHHGWLFGYSSQNVDLLALHPIPQQIATYWEIFRENVDPLIKILHIPSIEATVLASAAHLANLSKGFEALLFAIYYSVTTSLCSDECLAKLGEDRGVLLSRYRFAFEQALSRASFLTTEEIVVLQAFVMFLICLRRNSDARVIWSLTGLLVRMAQTLGIHRDGSHFGLGPFDIEIRRRLWWQICILDIRSSEDNGCDPTILEQSFDTKMPLNINDVDLDPAAKEYPTELLGCTDMSFSLIRMEVANTFRRLSYIPPGKIQYAQGTCLESQGPFTLEDKERWIRECHQRLEERHLRDCDMSVPIYWVTATVARLMMSKMWLMLYHPFQRQNGGAKLPEDVKDKLFITSLENIEYSILLQTEARTMKWGWLFKTYTQWHALAFLLSELRHRTRGELVERAWVAIEKVRQKRMAPSNDSRSGYLWKPLLRLLAKAQEAREKALLEDGSLKPPQATPPPLGPALYGSITELLENMKSRPRMVSAPLSRAQLERFRSPAAVYGAQPLDATRLLKATTSDQNKSTDDAMDLSLPTAPSALVPAPGLQSPQQQAGSTKDVTYPYNTPRSQTWPLNDPSNNQPTQGFLDYTLPQSADPQLASSGLAEAQILVNGELDWENWDQLVRQYSMDVEQTPGATGQAVDWGGPNWANFGNGGTMGIGPTDWL